MTRKKLKKTKGFGSSASVMERQQNFQLMVFFSVILVILGVLIGSYLYTHQLNNFKYGGVEFQRERLGESTLYHGRFPIIYQGKPIKVYNSFLRVDPRKNDVPIKTNFSLSGNVIISFQPTIEKCDRAIIAQSNLAQFVSVFPWVTQVSGAVTDRGYADEVNISFADCTQATNDTTVILVRLSESEGIERSGENDNCYILNVGECNYLEVSEKYILGVMAQINGEKI
jgi:hypothetical protein